MSKDPAFLFYPNDYLGGTMGMTFEEKGAYVELLMMQFNRGHMTSHMCGQLVGQLWDKIKCKFVQDENGLWFNARLDIEINKRSKYCESRKNNKTGKNQYVVKNRSYDLTYDEHMTSHMTGHMENENENIDCTDNDSVCSKITSTNTVNDQDDQRPDKKSDVWKNAQTLLMKMRVLHQEICGGRFGKYPHPSDLKKFTQKTQQRILDSVEEFGIDCVGGMMERWRNWMMDDQFAQSNNFKMELFFSRHGDYTDAAFYEPDPPNHAEHLAEAERLGIEMKKRHDEGMAQLREKGHALPNR